MSELRTGPVAPGIAFVTGGARGLGNAVALSFAKEGARGIAIVDIADDKTMQEGKAEVEKYSTKCITIRADITKEDDVKRAVEAAVAEFGRIDYAANFAGIAVREDFTWQMPYEAWRKVTSVNEDGVWLCTKYELAQMLKQDSIAVEPGRVFQRGSIVNCASVGSLQLGPRSTGYGAAKHAVVGITKSAALEAREHGIRVNAVSPGFLRTKLLDPIYGAIDREVVEQTWQEYESRQGRRGSLDEVGDVVVLLSTPRMSLVNGHNLFIDGGFTISAKN